MILLCLFHVLWFIPYATGEAGQLHAAHACLCALPQSLRSPLAPLHCSLCSAMCAPLWPPSTAASGAGSYTVESTGVRYECPQGIQLRVANYSLFALFAAAAINEALITVFGLRGELGAWICMMVSHTTALNERILGRGAMGVSWGGANGRRAGGAGQMRRCLARSAG